MLSLDPSLFCKYFPRLRRLSVCPLRCSDKNYWQAFGSLSDSLTSLCLRNCLLSDNDILHILTTLNNLSTMWLLNTPRITDAGLRLIPKHQKKLEDLGLLGLSEVTVEGILNLWSPDFSLKRFCFQGAIVFPLGQFLSQQRKLVALKLACFNVDGRIPKTLRGSSLKELSIGVVSITHKKRYWT